MTVPEQMEQGAVDERTRRYERAFEVPIFIAALLVIPVIAIEQSNVGDPWRSLAAILNWGIWIAFAVELVVMLAVVPDRWRWLRNHPLEVAVVVLTPPFLPAALQAFRVLRVLRLLRLIRVAPLAKRLFSLDGLRYASILAGFTAVLGGLTYSSVEEDKTLWDGFWWAVSTMTTVGYGDEYPVTVGGQLLAMGLMIVGIGFIAVLTGAIAERFLAVDIEQVADEVEEAEGDVRAELREIAERLHAIERRLGQRPI